MTQRATKPAAGREIAAQEGVDRRVDELLFELSQLADDESMDDVRRRAVLAQAAALESLLYRDLVDSQAALATRAELRAAIDAFTAVCPLELRNVQFCRAVESFGVVRPFPNRAFRAGQEVLLYVELENFQATMTTEGYETELRGQYRIADAKGRTVATRVLPTDKQTSINRRRDYFIAYRLHLPSDSTPGDYTLRLAIDDIKGRKGASSSLAFRVVP